MSHKDKKFVCTKKVAQYNCIVAVLLSTMNGRDEKNAHQSYGSIDFLVLLLH
jgi:hypothetical protein